MKLSEKWNDISIKDRLAYSTAIGAMIVGFGLCTASFFMMKSIGTDLLALLGEALIYAASIFTMSKYFSTKLLDIEKYMVKKIREIEESDKNE
jgi:hypothetical protein